MKTLTMFSPIYVTVTLCLLFTCRPGLAEENVQLSEALPIGTIIPSMLHPDKYGSATHNDSNWDPVASIWVPADGRSVVKSRYAGLIGVNVPDLRGMFIRGLNAFDSSSVRADGNQDPDSRTAGSVQPDSVGPHRHNYDDSSPEWRTNTNRPGWRNNNDGSDQERQTKPLDPSSFKETRPKNIAIYYYIRIN